MDWHVFIVFGAVFCVSCIYDVQSFSIREKRSPQNGGAFFQANGGLNLAGLNIQQVRRRLHDLVDTVTNPFNVNVMGQVTPEGTNYPSYEYDYQQYGHPPPGPPPGPPFEPPGHHRRGPPHRHHHRGPPPRDYQEGPPPRFPPPRGPPPRGPPPRGPPPRGPPPRGPPPYGEFPRPEGYDEDYEPTLPVTWPSDQPSDSSSTVNIDLSNPTPIPTNSNEKSQSGEDGNVAGYIEDNFPVILLNENEIR